MFTCSCNSKVKSIRLVNGKKTCAKCATLSLSGTFLRRLEEDARYYAADILQPGADGFDELYDQNRKQKRSIKS